MKRPNMEPSQPLTIAELEQKEGATASDIYETLRSYAEEGHSIRGAVITKAMEATELNGLDLEDIQEAATDGIIKLAENRCGSSNETVLREQAEYAHIVGRAGLMLKELAEK